MPSWTRAHRLRYSSDATGANGRQCILASIHIDRARYFLKIKDYDRFANYAWTCIDLSAICLFSALNLKLKTPLRDPIEQNFRHNLLFPVIMVVEELKTLVSIFII